MVLPFLFKRRKSFYSSHYTRERSPHKRDAPFFRESPVSRKDSPHSRSGSSVSSRSYSPERSKSYSFHQSQHSRNKDGPSVTSLKASRDTSPSSSTTVASSKAGDAGEKELAEAAKKWAAEKLEKTDEGNLPEISEYEAGSSAVLHSDQPGEAKTNVTEGTELSEDKQGTERSKAISSKIREVEESFLRSVGAREEGTPADSSEEAAAAVHHLAGVKESRRRRPRPLKEATPTRRPVTSSRPLSGAPATPP
ncbi:periphilin-1-like [Tachyglossus aculeatus]|uniref:periphilin-1-like n=1 Tax=Tachyglossus aculeatus TaxID=9261 RepID=UPI0018F6332B|nr:periphilin-1-like [Tachyglossus aculeatus]